MSNPSPNTNVNLSGSGSVPHVQRPDGALIPQQGTDAGELKVFVTNSPENEEANASLAAIDANTDGIESALGSTNSKLDTLLSQTDGLEGSATSTATNTGTTATQVTAIAGSVDQLEGYVDGLEGSATTTAAQATAINTNTDQLEGYLDGVEGKLDNVIGGVVTTDSRSTSNGAAASGTAKSGAGSLLAVMVRNGSSLTTLHVFLFDNTSASGTLICLPISLSPGDFVAIGTDIFTNDGTTFSTGLTWGFSTNSTSYSAHSTATDCRITLVYK